MNACVFMKIMENQICSDNLFYFPNRSESIKCASNNSTDDIKNGENYLHYKNSLVQKIKLKFENYRSFNKQSERFMHPC